MPDAAAVHCPRVHSPHPFVSQSGPAARQQATTDEARSRGAVSRVITFFDSSGPFPEALQQTWAATAAEWFPSNPWRLRPGPIILRYLEHTDTRATCEIWIPIEEA